MQNLYAANRDKTLIGNRQMAVNAYRRSIEQSYELFLFNVLQLREIAKFALKDQANRKNKHLPSEFDKKFSSKLYTNRLIQSTLDNEELVNSIENRKLKFLLTGDNTRLLYSDFAKTDEYKAYLKNEETTEQDDREILLFLYKYSVTGDIFNELMDDFFPNWWDDKSLVVGAMKKILKALPVDNEYVKALKPNYETVTEFGETLFIDVLSNDEELLGHIEPTLNNWDPERVAIIDMVLLKMALSELLNFPSIPTKVTLNEFVEIAKLYSTDKSKDFINGILDRLLKKLEEEGAIKKEGRGLV